jgi:hypothetical protein
MGDSSGGSPGATMSQKSVTVYPTRTIYVFQQSGVQLTLTFITPLIPSSLDLLSRPVTYLTYDVVSIDGRQHNVQIYYDNTGELVVNSVSEQVVWQRATTANGLNAMRIGTAAQNVLGMAGDGVGINWGYLYVATENSSTIQQSMALCQDTRGGFVSSGKLPADSKTMPVVVSNGWPVLATVFDLGSVGAQSVQRVLLLAYDDIYSMNYFGLRLQAYWRSIYNGDIHIMLDQAHKDYSSLVSTCTNFDNNLIATLSKVGGDEYATIASLAYRQTLAGTKMTWHPTLKKPWYFMKEISSDGDISTVDVIFPASPLFLYFNPDLLALQLIPVLEYANNATSNKYNLVWAPHHLGFWPIANIQTKDQENMPIEETANMLLMIAALERRKSTVDLSAYWQIFVQWADYLVSALPDPENQLCTDDFEGPIPHDSNLALKGILGITAFAQMCENRGNSTCSKYYMQIGQNYAAKWLSMSNPENTDHYRLRYDQPGWSLKYNMLFQYILGQNVFNASVMDMEIKYYKTQLHTYGIPLDLRSDFTKLDWQAWVAAMASDADFKTIIHAIYQFAHTTPDRVPLTDWYFTSTAKQRGFQARTVVGGVYAKMLLV